MKFNEIYQRVASLIDAAAIVRTEQIERLFEVNQINTQTAQNVLRTLSIRRDAYFDSTKKYLASTKGYSYSHLTPTLDKAIWLFVNMSDRFEWCNFQPKYPSVAYFYGVKNDQPDDLSVFYIPEDVEHIQSRMIETNYGGMQSKIPTALIFPSEIGIEKFKLSDDFDIKTVAIIDGLGNVQIQK